MSIDEGNERDTWCGIHHIWYQGETCSICVGEDIEEHRIQDGD